MTRNVSRSYLWIGIWIIVVDFLSKLWVHKMLPLMSYRYPFYPYGGVPVFEDFFGIEFSITHLTNRGAAWGIFGAYQDYLFAFRIVLILGMIIYLFYLNKYSSLGLPLCLVISGALGNVIDYFVYGHVVDMFHFLFWGYSFPVFNVADSAVCLGVIWLIIASNWQRSPLHES